MSTTHLAFTQTLLGLYCNNRCHFALPTLQWDVLTPLGHSFIYNRVFCTICAMWNKHGHCDMTPTTIWEFLPTLNYWMMVERYPNLNEKVGGLIPGCEITLTKYLLGGQLPPVLWRWPVSLLSPKKKTKNQKNPPPTVLVMPVSSTHVEMTKMCHF